MHDEPRRRQERHGNREEEGEMNECVVPGSATSVVALVARLFREQHVQPIAEYAQRSARTGHWYLLLLVLFLLLRSVGIVRCDMSLYAT